MLLGGAAGATVGYVGYEIVKQGNEFWDDTEDRFGSELSYWTPERGWVDERYSGKIERNHEYWQNESQIEEPPFTWKDLGNDSTKCTDKGFEWRGTGDPGSGQGNWVRGKKKDNNKEELHPGLNHPNPIGPHWDYKGPKFPEGIRIKPDGSWEPKRDK